jgi:cell filamentation protein, protein adenylyltransferase
LTLRCGPSWTGVSWRVGPLSISTFLPNPDLFLYCYVREEAVQSSQIEGTQSSLSDLLLFEVAGAPDVPFDDVVEVSNYVAALEHGLTRVKEALDDRTQ